MFQRVGAAAYKVDLSNTHRICEMLGHPENAGKYIHVAGTNGKGSVCHMLASVLQEAGYKVGLYTSPHLTDFRERIRINGEMISEDAVVEFVDTYRNQFESIQPSFFEITFGMGMWYFRQQACDVVVLETGMGGRLDSTNVVMPEVSVITNIGMDHTQFLGDTLAKIASEKAGIIKPEIPVVIGEEHPETKPVFVKKALEMDAEIYFASENTEALYECDLQGSFQERNQRTVLDAIEIIEERGFVVPVSAMERGLKHVISNTGLKGRWQQLGEQPLVFADTAHNVHGLTHVLHELSKLNYTQLRYVFGMVDDKNHAQVFELLPKDACYYFCKPNIPRGMDEKKLQELAEKAGMKGVAYASVPEAFAQAKKDADHTDLILVGGSTFVVAEVV